MNRDIVITILCIVLAAFMMAALVYGFDDCASRGGEFVQTLTGFGYKCVKLQVVGS
jgi:hypothetical protein